MYSYHEHYHDAYHAALEDIPWRDGRPADREFEPIRIPHIVNWLTGTSVILMMITLIIDTLR